ncbi:MAG: radical SAM protein [Candidatus Korarchaeum sp.]|nr:radical SAM protein [Candidatus Korarchaeum sp.]MDW8035921.1 radical SAM protein [Candidatus Korarchaeum sp.]
MIPKIASILTSSLDHPSSLSLSIYLPYCNLNCIACHNRELVEGRFEEVPLEDLIWELENNLLVDLVVISGGEPTVHGRNLLDLVSLIRNIREDLPIRVDSNGFLPEVMNLLVDQIDGFALDVKAPPMNREKYEFTVRRRYDPEMLIRSVEIASDLPYTVFRTVRYPWLTDDDLEEIRKFLATYGKERPHFINPYLEPMGTVPSTDLRKLLKEI